MESEDKETSSNTVLSDDIYLTYEHWLFNQESSAYDFLDNSSFIGDVDIQKAFVHEKPNKPNIMPYVKFTDLNNSDDAPYENPPHPAVEVGVKFEF